MSIARTIVRVFRKELRDTIRDRRAIMTVLVSSVLMGPLAMLLVARFVGGLEEKNARREVSVINESHAPGFVNFIQRQGYAIKHPPADFEARMKVGSFEGAVIRIPDDFDEQIARGRTISVDLVYDASQKSGSGQTNAATRLLRGYSQELGSLRLIARGVSPKLMHAVDINEVDLATTQSRGAQLLFLIPMFALFACMTGAITVAIDVTAGERERGSLEPLLMNPVSITALVAGKWAVVALYGCAVVVLTLTGFVVAMQFVTQETVIALFQFGAREFAVFGSLLLPFAGLAASALMLVAAYGRTFKEAQTYASYLYMIVALVPTFTTLMSIEPAFWQSLVPALGQQLTMGRATRGEAISALDIVVPGAVCLVGALICLALLGRLLRNEKVVFGRS
ncbi:ABC transporter permease [soil metagenome]